MVYNDIISEPDDEMPKYSWRFVLWPRQWNLAAKDQYLWHTCRFESSSRSSVPDHSGVYTFLIQPEICGHPACSYLMYVGKAKSLQSRFGNYLSEMRRETGRPRIVRLLNKYPQNTWFCFTLVAWDEVSKVEDMLIETYIPPCNDKFPAYIARVLKAYS